MIRMKKLKDQFQRETQHAFKELNSIKRKLTFFQNTSIRSKMSPKQWKKQLKENILKEYDQKNDILEALLPEAPGTCTNFAINFINQSPSLSFVLGDVGRHRIAWSCCEWKLVVYSWGIAEVMENPEWKKILSGIDTALCEYGMYIHTSHRVPNQKISHKIHRYTRGQKPSDA